MTGYEIVLAALVTVAMALMFVGAMCIRRQRDNLIGQRDKIRELKKVIAYEKVRYSDMHNAYISAHQKYLDVKQQLILQRGVDAALNKAPAHKRVTVEGETGRRSEPVPVVDPVFYAAQPSFTGSSYDSGSCSSYDSGSCSSREGVTNVPVESYKRMPEPVAAAPSVESDAVSGRHMGAVNDTVAPAPSYTPSYSSSPSDYGSSSCSSDSSSSSSSGNCD